MSKPLLILTGPTATGKSAIAVALAQQLHGEIVGADSQQVYRGADIGTGKLSLEERQGVPHHLIDVVDPDQPFDAAQFVVHADRVIAEIQARGKRPIVVGGTGLYLKGLVFGLCDLPSHDASIRAACAQILAAGGATALHAELERIDPDMALQIHPNHATRIVRAIEVKRLTGRSIGEIHRAHERTTRPRHEARWIGLTAPRDDLRARINARIDQQIADGWPQEVGRLLERYGPDIPIFRAIGYREFAAYLSRHPSPDPPGGGSPSPPRGEGMRTIRQSIYTATAHYAKRQLTYLRAIKAIAWVDISMKGDIGTRIREIASLCSQ